MAETDPYKILGVDRKADATALRNAYRKLAKKYHPDLNPGDKAAEEKFKSISGAYDLLSDEARRDAFDSKRQKQLVEDADIAARSIWKTYLGGIRA